MINKHNITKLYVMDHLTSLELNKVILAICLNIETNTTQPDDTKIGAATAAISSMVPDPTIFTATKDAVGANPGSTTTIIATPPMMALVGVTVVSQKQPIKKQETLDLIYAKGVWGLQLGNIPQVNIGDIYLSAGCSLNLSQMLQFYTIILALEEINVLRKYFSELASNNWNVIHTSQ